MYPIGRAVFVTMNTLILVFFLFVKIDNFMFYMSTLVMRKVCIIYKHISFFKIIISYYSCLIPDASSATTTISKSFLADLIASNNEERRLEDSDQMHGGPKPVIVLPPLGIRTARPRNSLGSSTVATTSPGGGTVVIMHTKPVISMGTR